jgi:hypothetical protein
LPPRIAVARPAIGNPGSCLPCCLLPAHVLLAVERVRAHGKHKGPGRRGRALHLCPLKRRKGYRPP